MSQNWPYLRQAHRKNAIFGTFRTNFLQNTAGFFQISGSRSSKLQCFGKKTQGLWGKTSSVLRKELKLFGFKTQRSGIDQILRTPTTINALKKACYIQVGIYSSRDTQFEY